MARRESNELVLRKAQLIYRNFAGKPSQYNAEGKRNTCVFIDDPELVDKLAADGWNVKFTKPRDEQDEPRAYIRINVNFDSYEPPKIVTVNNRGRTELTEEDVNMLDWADIDYVNMVVNPWRHNNGGGGTSGYLQGMHVVLRPDILEEIYEEDFEELPEQVGIPMCPDCQGCDGTGDCRHNDELPF